MNKTDLKVGYFVFSLDTELAWGRLWNQRKVELTPLDGLKERDTIKRLLGIMDEFGVVSTWAITGHLFYEKCEECEICPIMDLKGKDSRFEQIWGTRAPAWYGADIVEMLLSGNSRHEVAFHGYTHRLFSRLSEQEARFEIQEWLRLSKRRNIEHQSVIFPQGGIGHLKLFREAGFICYRGKEVRHPALRIPLLGKVLNQINLGLQILTPQVFEVELDPLGLVNIPSSQWLFRINRGVEKILDMMSMPVLRLQPTVRSIERAAEERKVVHLWAHPHEFRTEKDFEKLRYVFGHFAEQALAGRLQSITMADLARRILITPNADTAVGEHR